MPYAYDGGPGFGYGYDGGFGSSGLLGDGSLLELASLFGGGLLGDSFGGGLLDGGLLGGPLTGFGGYSPYGIDYCFGA